MSVPFLAYVYSLYQKIYKRIIYMRIYIYTHTYIYKYIYILNATPKIYYRTNNNENVKFFIAHLTSLKGQTRFTRSHDAFLSVKFE